MENSFKKSIKSMRITHNEFKKMGLMVCPLQTLQEVQREKWELSKVKSHLVKEMKTNSKRLSSYIKQIVKRC